MPQDSSLLSQETLAALGAGGALAKQQTHYQPRQAQLEMAARIAQTIEQAGTLVVEAGTGTGKTFAYLVPALLSGQRTLISTASKTLQDQLYARDLPHILAALGIHARTALLKGRANYLCIWRMQQARAQHLSSQQLALLPAVERWARHTQTGDFAELAAMENGSALLPWVSSSRDNCLGQNCPSYQDCHVVRARTQAMQADVVVINHHLFFADLALRESGFGQLLPQTQIVVLDEAHQLNETGVQFLGQRLASSQLLDLCRDTLAAGLQRARGLVDWQELVSTLEYATRELRLVIGKTWNAGQGHTRLRWQSACPEGLSEAAWQQGLGDVSAALAGLAAALDTVSEIGPDLQRLFERATELAQTLALFALPPTGEGVRWLEAAQHWQMVQAPLDIASTLQNHIQMPAASDTHLEAFLPVQAEKSAQAAIKNEVTAPLNALPQLAPLQNASPTHPAPPPPSPPSPRSWVFTSATLGDASNLHWFTQPCGLQNAPSLRLASPFDYPNQAALYIPPDMPPPAQAQAHSAAVADLAARSALILGGKTLVLTTTTRALRQIAAALREQLADTGMSVLEQGQGTKHELISALRQGKANTSPHQKTGTDARAEAGSKTKDEQGCILVATASLWEGIDIPGDALQLVIIDKLPFPPPGDPVVEARSQRLEAAGKNPFNHYAMPEAAVALKQGAGRLIRSESDRGALVVCDIRLANTAYGKRLVQALPPMKKLGSQAELLGYLKDLTQAPQQSIAIECHDTNTADATGRAHKKPTC